MNLFYKSLLVLSIFAVSHSTMNSTANAQVSGNSYAGWVVLETPTGHLVPYYWDVTFDNGSGIWMTAAGVPIDGFFVENGSSVAVLLNNAPYFSNFTGHTVGPYLVLDSFSDNDGNRLHYGSLLKK